MSNLKPIHKKQFLVTLEGVSAYFTKATAPKESRDEAEYNDGQAGTTYVALGFTKRDKVTLTKPFDPVADKAIVSWYKNRAKGNPNKFVTTIQPVNTDQQGTAISGAGKLSLIGCEVASFKMPDVDRDGSGLAMLEIELVHDDWSFT